MSNSESKLLESINFVTGPTQLTTQGESSQLCDAPMVTVSNLDADGKRTVYVTCWVKMNNPGGTAFTITNLSSGSIPNNHVVNREANQLNGTNITASYTSNADDYYAWFFSFKYDEGSGLGVEYVVLNDVSGVIGGETSRGTVTTPDDGVSGPGT